MARGKSRKPIRPKIRPKRKSIVNSNRRRFQKGGQSTSAFYEGMPTRKFESLYNCDIVEPPPTKKNYTIRRGCKPINPDIMGPRPHEKWEMLEPYE